jgi:hypothetical protein
MEKQKTMEFATAPDDNCIKPCRKIVTGRTLAIQLEVIHFLPVNFWGVEPPECGDKRMFHDKDSLVLCWDCALEQGVVNETERQYNDKIERVLDRLLK